MFQNRIQVEISGQGLAQGAEIRYTTDGTAPRDQSPLYTGPFDITESTLIRAQVFQNGAPASEIVAAPFSLVSSDLEDFSSNLPLVVLQTFRTTITETTKRPVYLALIEPQDGRASLHLEPAYNGRSGIEIRGSSSTQFPKKSYGVELRDETDMDRKVRWLGLPNESDWILYAPYTDKTLMRNVLAYELSNRAGRYAPRTRFVELFLNRGVGPLAMSHYQGVYVLIEKIKRDDSRVDIQRLDPDHNAEPEITGGYILKKDRLDPGDAGFNTGRGQRLGYVEPKEAELTQEQRLWIRFYLNRFETALYGPEFRDPLTGYQAYIDPGSFIDHHLLVELAKNIDGFRLSTFMYKDRNDKLHMGPIWDYNLSFGNANYLAGWQPEGWYWPQLGDGDYPWYRRLFQDSDFNQRYADRWAELRQTVFDPDSILALVDQYADELAEAQQRNYTRWRILGNYVWPNWYIGRTWQDEVDWMKDWIRDRIEWIDGSFLASPRFARTPGKLNPQDAIEISQGGAATYYTIDGTDPRAPGGGPAAGTARYDTPIPVPENGAIQVIARARSGNRWSAPIRGMFYKGPPPIRISEIHYNPAASEALPGFDAGDLEFIELSNHGAVTIDLAGFAIAEGITFRFDNSELLAPGESLVLVKDGEAFGMRYGANVRIGGEFSGSLSNGGERLVLHGPSDEIIEDFEYDDRWYSATDGQGFSLVRGDGSGSLDAGTAAAWAPSRELGGSPGAPDDEDGYETWLVKHFSTAERQQPEIAGKDADPDQDGFNNWDEFSAGTDPRSASSKLEFASIELDGTGIKLEFSAAPNRTYSVFACDSLEEGNWVKLGDFAAMPDESTRAVIDSSGIQGTRFYRLVTPATTPGEDAGGPGLSSANGGTVAR